MSAPEWDRTTPWRQGHLLAAETVTACELSDAATAHTVAAVVVSHDCDLTQLVDSEPAVEIILGRFHHAVPDGNLTHAKNPRTLQISYQATGGDVTVELDAARRLFLPKEKLVGHLPSSELALTPQEKRVLQTWLAARYKRAAYPDEFENRLKGTTKVSDKLSKALKAASKYVRAIFFDVDNGSEIERSGADDPYVLFIVILYATDETPAEAEVSALALAKRIEEIFKAECKNSKGEWQWIELQGVQVMSDEALTYAQSLQLTVWRSDHISLKSDENDPTLD